VPQKNDISNIAQNRAAQNQKEKKKEQSKEKKEFWVRIWNTS
jgi:hypothetical protein